MYRKKSLVGVGIEWAFAPNWSVKIEYDYLAGCGKTEQGSRSDSDPFTWGFGYVHGQNEFFRSLLGLSSQTFTAPAGGFLAGDTFITSNPNVQMVKVGANYLFKYGVGGY